MNKMNKKELPEAELQELLPHIFLPRRLPDKEQDGLILIEQNIILLLKWTTAELNNDVWNNYLPKTCKLFHNWTIVQPQLSEAHSTSSTESTLQNVSEIIKSMGAEEMVAFYIRAQNAGFLISTPSKMEDDSYTGSEGTENHKNVILSSFRASCPSESVMSTSVSPGDLIVFVPEISVLVPRSSLLHSEVFVQHLEHLSCTPIDMAQAKSTKAGQTFIEVRDTADPMFITKWLTSALCTEQSTANPVFPRIRKKVRDDVIWNDTLVPFRRSGIWMTAKVALQISLIRELGPEIGFIIYKAVLIKLMHCILIHQPEKIKHNLDIKIQMLAKMARRLEKLRRILKSSCIISVDQKIPGFVYEGAANIIALITSDIIITRSQMNLQWDRTVMEPQPHKSICFTDGELQDDTVNEMDNLKTYIQKRIIEQLQSDCKIDVPNPKCPTRQKSMAFHKFLYSKTGYEVDVELHDTEVWIMKHLEKYCAKENSEFIWNLISDYSKKASTHYINDPVSNSRMILSVLKCIQVLDEIATKEYPKLLEHKAGVNLKGLKDLLVPLKSDMESLLELEIYFNRRDSNATFPSLLDEDSPSESSFSVRFAKNFEPMICLRKLILKDAEIAIEEKKEEVLTARQKYNDLGSRISKMSCDYHWNSYEKRNDHYRYCTLCALTKEREKLLHSVKPYGRPLPNNEGNQFAVVFELLIPPPIAYLRDALHLFRVDICSYESFTCTPEDIHTNWQLYGPLRTHSNDEGKVVSLGTTIKSTAETHYAQNTQVSVTSDVSNFILNNGMNVFFNATKVISGMEGRKLRCTFRIGLNNPYDKLQWAVNSTSHTENQVLARQSSCPQDLSLAEFHQFGILRTGHRLQYRNIIMSLTNGKLSLKAEPVFLLLCQTEWEAGPPASTANFLRESHLDLSETPLGNGLLTILNGLVDANSKNWSDAYTLMCLIVTGTRLLELSADVEIQDRVSKFLRKCRKIANEWVRIIRDLICQASEASEDDKVSLKLKLVSAALCSVLTFHVSPKNVKVVMSCSEDLVFWLNAVSTLYDEIHWNTAGQSFVLSAAQRALLRLSIRIGISLEETINELVRVTNGQGLTSFTQNRWKAATSFDNWTCCAAPADQVYECCHVVSNNGVSHVHIDIILGKFLVDGCPVGTLSEDLVKLTEYQRVFLKADFRVQPNKGIIFTTTTMYHGCIYEFSVKNSNLIVKEMKCESGGEGQRQLELISHSLLQNKVPLNLVEKYSHWWNSAENSILFRPKEFNDPDFADSVTYVLCLKTMILMEAQMLDKKLVSVNSPTFAKLTRTLRCIEPTAFIHVWKTDVGNIEIELDRLKLKFTLGINGDLMSHEFPGMKISADQNLQTLVGLKNKLILIGKQITTSFQADRRLIIPHGHLSRQHDVHTLHQSTLIDLKNQREPRFFVYDLDERFKTLKPGRNQSACLFLAALHASTSSPLPDPFTGVTGTEMAFQILQQARCWSSKPFDQVSIEILNMIAKLSPRRIYYPSHMECMQQVHWPTCLPSTSAHEGFAELVLRLYSDSIRLETLFELNPSDESDDHRTNKKLDKKILKKSSRNLRLRHYWRQQPFENEMAMISKEFDREFRKTRLVPRVYSFESLLTNSNRKKKTEDIRLIADLCYNWTFHLEDQMINNVRAMLITGEDLIGSSTAWEEQIGEVSKIEDWLNYELRDEWIDLYSFALSVTRNIQRSKWALILATLAFQGVPLEQILILQAVAADPEGFPEPPTFPQYRRPSETYNSHVIRCILTKHAEPFAETSWSGNRLYSTAEACQEARRLHNSVVETETETILNEVGRQWKEGQVNQYTRKVRMPSKINISEAVTEIDNNLKEWNKNLQLSQFIENIEENLRRLLSTSSNKPQIDDFQSQPVDESPIETFMIDFDKILTRKMTRDDPTLTDMYTTGSVDVKEDIVNSTDRDQDGAYHDQNLKILTLRSRRTWNDLTTLMTPPGSEALVAAGLYPHLTPCQLFPVLMKKFDNQSWKLVQDYIGAVGVMWTHVQRHSRCITYIDAKDSMKVALQRELATQGHEEWSPREHPGWLVLELEMNMMIRPIQLKVAREMMDPKKSKNSVLQLNMGEGKTALIVPMLANALAIGTELCRVTVLKSIFETNVMTLQHTLGCLLNQRIYTVPCRRDLEMNPDAVKRVLSTYEDCMQSRGIVVTLPEYRLSFKLKGFEMSRNGEGEMAEALLETQAWLDAYARDILDESDEILSVKYQLVYTVGEQQDVGGGEFRWIIAQKLLKLLPQRMKDLLEKHGESAVEYGCQENEQESPEKFTPCRLLRKECYKDLIDSLAEDFLDGKLVSFPKLKDHERLLVKQFLTNEGITEAQHRSALEIFKGDDKNHDIILILAGYLRYEVLQAALMKRWRVNYGVKPNGQHKTAVPFKAKDVASERTEFGHPDMAIVLTQISYYYSGLSDEELRCCFDILRCRHSDPVGEYDSWIQTIPPKKVDSSVRNFKTINLSDYDQRTRLLFPMLKKVMAIIDFWLSNVVFPKESKQFPGKMTCTAWDLCSANQALLTTGFSGTKDSSNLYPPMISQTDLAELENTNRELEAVLLRDENNKYRNLPRGTTCKELLQELQSSKIRVLLDCGALMLELNNEGVAEAWLEIDQEIQAVVYFSKGNVLTVKSRMGNDVQFELSPFRDRLGVCAIYLDDEHTRGTDLKFPSGSVAAVTIGSGLTRDKLVQACMRMRMLGRGHTVSFWASQEAHNKIQELNDGNCSSKDVLEWVRWNSTQYQDQGLMYWAASGVNYCLKLGAEAIFKSKDNKINRNLIQLGEHCSEKEVSELLLMYGQFRREDLFVNIIPMWFSHAKRALTEQNLPQNAVEMFADVENTVLDRCRMFIPEAKTFSQLLDEEQEKELEQELEDEREKYRPGEATPQNHSSDLRGLIQACNVEDLCSLLAVGQVSNLKLGFKNTVFWGRVQDENWGNQLYVTNDFINTIIPKHVKDPLEFFLRPPAWVISMKNSGVLTLILISPFEANELLPQFRDGKVAGVLHIYCPRLLPDQVTLINSQDFCVPSSLENIDLEDALLAPLSLFSGALYFENAEEERVTAHFLGIIPGPDMKEGFDRGEIDRNGFVKLNYRDGFASSIRNDGFQENPGKLIGDIARSRNQGYLPPNSHIGRLVFDGMKNELQVKVSVENPSKP